MASNFLLQQKIIEAIDKRIEKLLPQHLKFNYYIDGVVLTVNGDGTYNVKANDDEYRLKAKQGVTLQANDIVLIMIPNGNKSNMFIDGKRPF